MDYSLKDEKYYELVLPVITGLGHQIVELKSRIVQRQLHVNLVLYNEKGISVNDCAEVYRTLLPRIEIAAESRDVHLEVASPGLGRNLKSLDEAEIFAGAEAKLLLENEPEWISGILGQINNGFLELLEAQPSPAAGQPAVKQRIPVSEIKKIKLEV